MNARFRRVLFWAPRALGIAFLAFLSLFALDVFREGSGFWQTLLALTVHLVPVFILAVVLALAWRWEWIGAALFAGAGALYVAWVLGRQLPGAMKFNWILSIAGPAFVVAALFLANWLMRAELHGRNRPASS